MTTTSKPRSFSERSGVSQVQSGYLTNLWQKPGNRWGGTPMPFKAGKGTEPSEVAVAFPNLQRYMIWALVEKGVEIGEDGLAKTFTIVAHPMMRDANGVEVQDFCADPSKWLRNSEGKPYLGRLRHRKQKRNEATRKANESESFDMWVGVLELAPGRKHTCTLMLSKDEMKQEQNTAAFIKYNIAEYEPPTVCPTVLDFDLDGGTPAQALTDNTPTGRNGNLLRPEDIDSFEDKNNEIVRDTGSNSARATPSID